MSREVWGTFSVSDHCASKAFVADVMLYDRLVVPVPPRNDQAEWQRWTTNAWNPERQQRLVEILRRYDRVKTVEWDVPIQDLWSKRMEAGGMVAQQTAGYAFQATRTVLTMNLPPEVTGVESITAYPSLEEIEADLAIKKENNGVVLPATAVTAVLGREFLVPDHPKMTDEKLLKEAVSLSSDATFRRKRAQFWRWQREFLGYDVVTDKKAISAAVEEMRELLEEEKSIVRKERIRTVARFAFLVGSVTLGMFGVGMAGVALAPMAKALGGAFLSVGQFTAESLLKVNDQGQRAAAMFHDAKRHFGWKGRAKSARKES
jgi:hypothetical protein